MQSPPVQMPPSASTLKKRVLTKRRSPIADTPAGCDVKRRSLKPLLKLKTEALPHAGPLVASPLVAGQIKALRPLRTNNHRSDDLCPKLCSARREMHPVRDVVGGFSSS